MSLKLIKSNVFFLLVAVLLAFGLYQTLGTALGTDVPIVTVVSPSMEPALERGDLIIVREGKIEDLKVGKEGSILVYESEYLPMPIIHRVISKDKNSVETKGDNNNHQVKVCVGDKKAYRSDNGCRNGDKVVNIEKNVTQNQMLGKAVFTIPKLGYLKLYPTCLLLKARLPSDSARLDYTCG